MRTLLSFALVAALGCGLVPKMREDRTEWAQVAKTSAPPGALELVPIRMGTQKAPACAPASGASCWSCVELVHAAYLVKHPRATFLIDAGLSSHTDDDLARFPLGVRLALAYAAELPLGESLRELGSPRVDFVLVTHAHWDHTGGLLDLERPRVVLGPGEIEYVRSFPKNKPPTVMPHHLENAVLDTFAWDGPPYAAFPKSHDVFGDGSVVLVPLPGHTPGSIGVFVNGVRGRRLLFVGDAAWSLDAIEGPSHKLAPLSDLADDDRERLGETLWRLHHLHAIDRDLLVVPTHDGRVHRELRALVGPDRASDTSLNVPQ